MRVFDTEISGLKIIEPDIWRDERGSFVETFNAERYARAGIAAEFVQDNESVSSKGVLRGLHWQSSEYSQAKLVHVVKGAVWDVAVDIRMGSPTFGRYVAVELTAEKGTQLFIPRGFAHGFLVLEDNTVFSYKCDNIYVKDHERGLLYSDSSVGIRWPDIGVPYILSAKDKVNARLDDIEPWYDLRQKKDAVK